MKSKKSSSARSDKVFFKKRLQTLQKSLPYDLCLIDAPLDLLYLTGLKLSAGYLIVSRDAAALFVDGRYIQVAKETAPMPAILDGPGALEKHLKPLKAKKMAFDGGRISYDQSIRLKKRMKSVGVQLVPASSIYPPLRVIKDVGEIDKMRKSAQLAYEGFLHIKSILKVGITEREVARRFEIFCLEKGAEKLSFEPIIAFGCNSAMPHYHPQNVPLQSGDIVLIDIGVVLDQYHSDMTRVLFFQKQDPFFKKVYEVVVASQRAALAKCRPGATVAELDLAARKVMKEAKLEDYFIHSLGHGIGLETHEYPRLKSQGEGTNICLEKGMVVTVEPGLYFPGRGGIRYEDTVVVTEKGHENFYPQIASRELIVTGGAR